MEKIKIAVCDNNSVVIENVAKVIDNVSESRRVDIDYRSFTSYEQLIGRINEFDLFILDYNMADGDDDLSFEDKINGMEFARLIRQHDEKKGIIFITAFPEFVYESFEVRTYRFLVKPIDENLLFDAIQTFIDNTAESGKLLVNINKEIHPINIDEIVYLEVSGKNTTICTENDILKCRKPIASFEKELLPFYFYRVHRSYIVNINKIKQFNAKTVILKNGKKIFISPKSYPGLCELYLQNRNRLI